MSMKDVHHSRLDAHHQCQHLLTILLPETTEDLYIEDSFLMHPSLAAEECAFKAICMSKDYNEMHPIKDDKESRLTVSHQRWSWGKYRIEGVFLRASPKMCTSASSGIFALGSDRSEGSPNEWTGNLSNSCNTAGPMWSCTSTKHYWSNTKSLHLKHLYRQKQLHEASDQYKVSSLVSW